MPGIENPFVDRDTSRSAIPNLNDLSGDMFRIPDAEYMNEGCIKSYLRTNVEAYVSFEPNRIELDDT